MQSKANSGGGDGRIFTKRKRRRKLPTTTLVRCEEKKRGQSAPVATFACQHTRPGGAKRKRAHWHTVRSILLVVATHGDAAAPTTTAARGGLGVWEVRRASDACLTT